jgi:cytochrome o ubiquinol oxidase subunit 1
VTDRDNFWVEKQAALKSKKTTKPQYESIRLPKNSGMGVFIAGFAFLLGFGLIWHMWWLAVVGFVGVIVCVILRVSNDETEYMITAKHMEQYDKMYKLQEPTV